MKAAPIRRGIPPGIGAGVLLAALLAGAMLPTPSAASGAATPWQAPVPIPAPAGVHGTRIVTTGGGEVVAIWLEPRTSASEPLRLKSAVKSSNGGFGDAMTLDETRDGSLYDPELVTDGRGGAVAVWTRAGEGSEIRLASKPIGRPFTPSQTVATGEGKAHVAANSRGETVVTFSRFGVGGRRIWSSFRPAVGEFGSPEEVSPSGPASPERAVAPVALSRDGDTVVVWTAKSSTGHPEVLAAVRPRSGSFGPLQRLSRPDLEGISPRVAVDGSGAAVAAWIERQVGAGAGEVVAAFRSPGGAFADRVFLRGATDGRGNFRVDASDYGEALVGFQDIEPRAGGETSIAGVRAALGSARVPGFAPTADLSDGVDDRYPAYAMGARGHAVAAWDDGPNRSIQAVRRSPCAEFGAPEPVVDGPPRRGDVWQAAVDPEGGTAVLVSYLEDHRFRVVVASPPALEEAASCPPPVNRTAPSTPAYPRVGRTLRATPGAWAPAPVRFDYRWRRCAPDGEDCEDIPDATSATYEAGPNDLGRRLRVRVTGQGVGGAGSAESAPTGPVEPPSDVPDGPTQVGLSGDTLMISGTLATDNHLRVEEVDRWRERRYVVSENAAPLEAGPGCQAFEGRSGEVTCRGFVATIHVDLGEGRDALRAAAAIPTVVSAGGGADDVEIDRGVVRGGPGDDILTGGSLHGEAGNDVLTGGGYGGEGDDVIVGGRLLCGGDELPSGSRDGHHGCGLVNTGNDRLTADPTDDRLIGGDGDDRLTGAAGKDVFYGDDGDDVIDATGDPPDPPGSGGFLFAGTGPHDWIDAGAGDDRIDTRDGAHDQAFCLAGYDRIAADPGDAIGDFDCEEVDPPRLRPSPPTSPRPPANSPPPLTALPDLELPKAVIMTSPSRLIATVGCSPRSGGRCAGSLALTGRTQGSSSGRRSRTQRRVLARTRFSLTPGTRRRLRLRLSRSAARSLRRRSTPQLQLASEMIVGRRRIFETTSVTLRRRQPTRGTE